MFAQSRKQSVAIMLYQSSLKELILLFASQINHFLIMFEHFCSCDGHFS